MAGQKRPPFTLHPGHAACGRAFSAVVPLPPVPERPWPGIRYTPLRSRGTVHRTWQQFHLRAITHHCNWLIRLHIGLARSGELQLCCGHADIEQFHAGRKLCAFEIKADFLLQTGYWYIQIPRPIYDSRVGGKRIQMNTEMIPPPFQIIILNYEN